MENTNRSDVERFFKDMPRNLQLEAIRNLNRQKKPPDATENNAIKSLHDAQLEIWERVKTDIVGK